VRIGKMESVEDIDMPLKAGEIVRKGPLRFEELAKERIAARELAEELGKEKVPVRLKKREALAKQSQSRIPVRKYKVKTTDHIPEDCFMCGAKLEELVDSNGDLIELRCPEEPPHVVYEVEL
jgi:hypothetical protein